MQELYWGFFFGFVKVFEVEVYFEYFDVKWWLNFEYFDGFIDFFVYKYGEWQLDVLIFVDDFVFD